MIQSLESRRLFAATASANGRTLSIVGDGAADDILLQSDVDNLRIVVTIDQGAPQQFPIGNTNIIRIFGGDGDDTINIDFTFALACTIYGGAGNDQIYAEDRMFLRAYGDDGDDTIIAESQVSSEGRDTVYGGAGNDTLGTNLGRDFVSGDDGADNINSGKGRDIIYGGSGNDQINAGGYSFDLKADTVYAGGGNDTVSTWAGDDFIEGGNGDDLLIGWSGHDTIIGGQGTDEIYGNDQSLSDANTGPDTFAQSEFDRDEVQDFEEGVDELNN